MTHSAHHAQRQRRRSEGPVATAGREIWGVQRVGWQFLTAGSGWSCLLTHTTRGLGPVRADVPSDGARTSAKPHHLVSDPGMNADPSRRAIGILSLLRAGATAEQSVPHSVTSPIPIPEGLPSPPELFPGFGLGAQTRFVCSPPLSVPDCAAPTDPRLRRCHRGVCSRGQRGRGAPRQDERPGREKVDLCGRHLPPPSTTHDAHTYTTSHSVKEPTDS